MTPEGLAELHARSITMPRPWTAAEFAELLVMPGVFIVGGPDGFAMGRVIADEAELLTLVVAPERRRLGLGAQMLDRFESDAIARGAQTAFLEVAATNTAARALYARAGYAEAGVRRGYYADPAGARVDALVLRRDLNARETA